MFYSWLVDEGARTPEEESGGQLARKDALPGCATAIDAIGLFNKRAHTRSPSVCRFGRF